MVAPDWRVSFDGVTEAATPNAASTGGLLPDPIGAGTAQALAAAAIRGARGCELVGGGAGQARFWDVPLTPSAIAAFQVYFLAGAAYRPAVDPWVMASLRSGGSQRVGIQMLANGRVQVTQSGGGTALNVNGTTALPDGWYVATVIAVKGTGAADGRILVWVREVGTDALVTSGSLDSSTMNTGTADFDVLRLGKPSSSANTNGTHRIDEPAYKLGSLLEIDRVPEFAAALSSSASTVEPGQEFTLDASASTGAVSSIVQVSGPTASVASIAGSTTTRTVSGPFTVAGGPMVFRTTVAGGDTEDVTVTLLPATELVADGGTMKAAQLISLPELPRLGTLSVERPVVTTGAAADPAYSVAYAIPTGYPGSWPVDTGEGLDGLSSNFELSNPPQMPRLMRVRCTSTRLALFTRNAGGLDSFLLFIDGKPWKRELTAFAAGDSLTTIVFPTARNRLIEIISTCGIRGVYTDPPYACTLPSPNLGPKLLLVGDSYMAGVTMNGNHPSAVESARMSGYASRLGSHLGIDRVIVDAIGGTGFLRKNGGLDNNYNDRRASHIAYAPHIVVVGGGGSNDLIVPHTVGDIIAAATTYFTQLRAALPNTKLVFTEGLAPPNGYSGFNDEYIAIRAGLQAALAAVGVYYVDVATTAPWINGTGWKGNTTGAGNSDTLIGGDGIHPTTEGHTHILSKLVPVLRKVVADDGALVNTLIAA